MATSRRLFLKITAALVGILGFTFSRINLVFGRSDASSTEAQTQPFGQQGINSGVDKDGISRVFLVTGGTAEENTQ